MCLCRRQELPFKAPQRAHQRRVTTGDSLEGLPSFGEVQFAIPKPLSPPHIDPKIAPKRSKMVQNKIPEVTGFHRSFKVSWIAGGFSEASRVRAYVSACMAGIWPDIDTHTYLLLYHVIWPPHTVCVTSCHVCLWLMVLYMTVDYHFFFFFLLI